jgi:putative ribosome biogenesis GTPase RsgA
VGELSVAEVLEMAVANAAQSAATSDRNAREQAEALRRYGDTTYNVGMVQADYQQKLAKTANRVAPYLMLGSGLTGLGKSAMTAPGVYNELGSWLGLGGK